MQDAARIAGRYEIVRQIGRGGMARVFLARQTDLDRDVALKEVAGLRQADDTFIRRFFRESRLVGSLQHPNIVTVYEYFEDDGVPYIAMEYLEAGSLRQYVGDLTLVQVAGVLEGVLAGLAHAQARGIVHRDLKPENVMLDDAGRVKIADFGIAKATGDAATTGALTVSGMMIGTPRYMAPEQALSLEIGPWTDLYSVGCMAYEMLTGDPPFTDGATPMALLMQHVSRPPVPLHVREPSLDPAIAAWVDKLLAKDPAERWSSAVDAWDELEELVITVLGPRWRRGARIPEDAAAPAEASRPLTPAPFESDLARTPPEAGGVTPDPGVRNPPPPAGRERVQSLAGAPVAVASSAPTAEETRTPEREPSVVRAAPAEPVAALALTADRDVPPAGAVGRAALAATPRRYGRAAALAGTAVLLAVVGYLAAPAGSTRRAPTPLAETATGPAVSLSSPARFEPVRAPSGLSLRDPVALGKDGRRQELVAAGTSRATGPTLLPAGLAAGSDEGPAPTRVRLGSLEAYRYDGLRPLGSDEPMNVYVAPTTAGVATVLCMAPPERLEAFTPDCERIAQTLRLRGARRLPLGPSPAYARRVGRALRTLGRDRAAAVSRMRSASRPGAQAAAATAGSRALARASAAVAASASSPYDRSANSAVVAALNRTASAYGGLARAARAGDRAQYAAGRRAVTRAEDVLDRSISDLRPLGYVVGS